MKSIPLTQGKFALVDDEDYDELSKFKWFLNNTGYAARNIYKDGKRTTLLMHRQILGIDSDRSIDVDHVDMNRIHNCRANLRPCTRNQNLYNRMKPASGKSCSSKGVSRRNDSGNWRAYISADGKFINLGTYETEDEAAHAYNKAAIKMHGEFATLNPVGI